MTMEILESNKSMEIGIIKISRIIALFSFVIGSILLTLFYLTEHAILISIGLFYVLFAVVVNSFFLIGLIAKLFSKESDKKQSWISIGIVALNIPVVILYTTIAMNIIGPITD